MHSLSKRAIISIMHMAC